VFAGQERITVFTLESIVPRGRSLDEYVAMFELSKADLNTKILGCADGPASFNAEMYSQGRIVSSVDPIYQFSADQIQARIKATYPTIMEQLQKNLKDYVWTQFSSPEALGEYRMATMKKFLDDFSKGKEEGRYISQNLPELSFEDQSFDFVLCSHFLFLYSSQLSAEFHCRAIQEMLRVATEIRIFPLLTLGCQLSPHLESVYEFLHKFDRKYEIQTVGYEFQRGGNQMLKIW